MNKKFKVGSTLLIVSAIIVGCFVSAMFASYVVIVGLALISLFFLVLGIKNICDNNSSQDYVLLLSLSGIFLSCEGNPLKDTFNLPQIVPDACFWLFFISWLGLGYVLLVEIGIFEKS